MTYDIYRYIFIGAAALAGVMLIVSIIIFIVFNIPKIISDLSGATARKAIKNIRAQNEASGDKAYKGSTFNQARGKLTDKISPSGNIIQQQNVATYGMDTAKISTQNLVGEANQTTVLETASETTVLSTDTETTMLHPNVCTGAAEAQFSSETTVLNAVPQSPAVVVEFEITYIHSNEIIPTEVM